MKKIIKGLFAVLFAFLLFGCDAPEHAGANDEETNNSVVIETSRKIVYTVDYSIEGKDVIIVEDIIDSGRTLSYLYEMLKSRNPKSLKICTLLDKPDRRIPESTITVDYTGFVIEDKFVVGYGLDDVQKLRNLPYVGVIED